VAACGARAAANDALDGSLSSRSPASPPAWSPPSRQGLREAGFVEGRNLAIAFRWADGRYDSLPARAAELVDLPVTLIFAAGGPSTAFAVPLRIMHRINAAAIFSMIGSGWRIYNDDVPFGWLHFPDFLVIGKWAQYGLQWHFFGIWIFVLDPKQK
jgi:hypothetical protein